MTANIKKQKDRLALKLQLYWKLGEVERLYKILNCFLQPPEMKQFIYCLHI